SNWSFPTCGIVGRRFYCGTDSPQCCFKQDGQT
ncbi:hypothetical protein A2U01_0076323, partial [Trifolium medium]|nr:hypothetical protein [Trifolium medium]